MSLPISIKEVPFFRLLVPFVAGIACQYWLQPLPYSWVNFIILLILLAFVFTAYIYSSKWQLRWLFGFSISFFLFFTGILATIKEPSTDKLTVNSNNRAIISLLDNPQPRSKSIRAEVEVKYVQLNSIWMPVKEKMLVYFDICDSFALNLQYGSLLAVNLVPNTIPQSGNPNQFNYKQYLSDRGVSYSAYLTPNSWIFLGNDGTLIKKIALKLRDRLVQLFKSNGLTGNELAVASALTLGYQDLLDDELRQVYSSSGAMHILSVSGLHVGVLYVLLSFLLSFMNKKVFTRFLKTFILLLFLWFFALLTGLAPCVQRSVLMFSFLVIGDFFMKKSNIYNTLAASAFVLLIINPYNLLDIGFQLSYLAIASIVFFYPYIYKLFYVKSWALDKVWSLIAVSLAAQLGTFSISLFYFNQFPNWFLLGNLVAIPLSTIALYLSVLLIVTSPFHIIAHYVGIAFAYSIYLLNYGLSQIEKLPFAVSEGLKISALQMFIILGATLMITLYLISKRYRYIFSTLLLLAVFLMLNSFSILKKASTKEFIVFNVNKKSLVSFRSGDQLIFFDADTSKIKFEDKYNFYIKGYLSSVGANKTYKVSNLSQEDIKSSFIQSKTLKGIALVNFEGKAIAIPFNKDLDKQSCKRRLSIDYLIINRYYPKRIFDFIEPRMVIIDSSVSKRALTEITTKCSQEGIPYRITSLQGAFILKATKG